MQFKKISIPFILPLLFALNANSQYTLSTPDGKRVKLNPNGTWQFIKEKQTILVEVPIDKDTIAIYRATNRKFSITYNPIDWNCDSIGQKSINGWDAAFISKDLAVTAYCLASRLSLPIDELEKGMRLQWKEMGNITSFNTYQDTINSIPVISFDMNIENKGINYSYKGYTYSTHIGSFQFVVGTQDNVFEEDRTKIDLLIKGFKKL